MAKVAHVTTVHSRDDTRVFLKQCRSLAAGRHDVWLIVADGLGNEDRGDVRIVDIGKPHGRVERMLKGTSRMLRCALALDAEVYQLHDPELLPAGLALKRRGKRVIFDAHEDLPRQILAKTYLHQRVRGSIATVMGGIERFACRKFDAVIGATPTIRDKFVGMGIDAVDINNFPILGELEADIPWERKSREVCYVGGVASIRGIREMVGAMALTRSGARLNIAGSFAEKDVQAEVKKMPGWAGVNELGFLSRVGVRNVLGRSLAGLVTLHPTSAYVHSLPIKMFEYMSAGLPVISAGFPLWRDIIEGNDCGVCVDPLDPKAIAAAIDHLVSNPDVARRMGENGRRAVQARYNWGAEEKKLLALYAKLASGT